MSQSSDATTHELTDHGLTDSRTIRFEVEDTGVGIPPEQLERIFQPVRAGRRAGAPDRGHRPGPGDQPPAGAADGRRDPGRQRSRAGQPLLVRAGCAGAAGAVEPRQPSDRVITGYSGPRRTVLVVDDIAANRAVLVELLRPLGFELVEAADGQEALELAQAMRPDLILMDRTMPVLDGLEATRQLRQLPALRSVPIIAVSASVSDADQAQSQEMGYDAFLPKPIHWPQPGGAAGRPPAAGMGV